MIRSTFGAPFGGTRRGGQYCLDWVVLSLMTPPNLGGGAGSWLPGIVVVALGEPGVPVICCARAAPPGASSRQATSADRTRGATPKSDSFLGRIGLLP